MAAPTTCRYPNSVPGATNVNVTSVDATFDPPIQGFIASVAGIVKVDFAPGFRTDYGTALIPAAVGIPFFGPIVKIYSTGTTNTQANICVLQ